MNPGDGANRCTSIFMSPLSLTAEWPGQTAESLLWLASYPRSGSTFTRILLANYFLSGNEDYDINKLSNLLPSDTAAELWQHFSGQLTGKDSIEAVWKTRPAFFERYRRMKDHRRAFSCLKTHSANAMAFGSPGFDLRPTDRVIYVVRHPLDVLLSLADFEGVDLDVALNAMCRAGLSIRTPKIGGLEVRGSWLEHVSSWMTSPRCPLFLVRYEELQTSTEQTLRGLLSFLGAPIVEDRVKHAVTASQFDKMRKQENAQGFNERPCTTKSGRFFREGKPLQWLRDLSPSQAYRLADGCEPVMSRLGYTHPREVFFDGRNALRPLKTGC